MVRISFFTCLFLIALRLVIGWHFFFEGMYKVRTHNIGETETNKPFTSAGYFGSVQGPLAKKVREYVGTDDSVALAKLTLSGGPDDKPTVRMPVALAKEWDDYLKQFDKEYKLDDAGKQLANVKLDQAKQEFVLWITDEIPAQKDGKEKKKSDEPKKISKKVVTVNSTVEYEIDDKRMQRIQDYKSQLQSIVEAIEQKNPDFGKDVEKTRMPVMMAEAATMRKALMKDVDEQTDKFKQSLAKLVTDKLAGYSFGSPEDQLYVDGRVIAMLNLKPGTDNTDDALVQRMPDALAQQWEEYYAFERETGTDAQRVDPKNGDKALSDAKLRYVRYLTDRDQFTGQPKADKDVGDRLAAYRTAIAKLHEARDNFKNSPTPLNFLLVAQNTPETARLRKTFLEDIGGQTEYLKKVLGGFKDDGYKGIADTEKPKSKFLGHAWPTTRLEWMDWSVRWGLLVCGGCLLAGLFTRLAAVGCISFLIMEFLLNPSLPWLPGSPKSEGNYTFISKNAVELMALFVLMTIPTGRWFGIDSILAWLFQGKKKTQ